METILQQKSIFLTLFYFKHSQNEENFKNCGRICFIGRIFVGSLFCDLEKTGNFFLFVVKIIVWNFQWLVLYLCKKGEFLFNSVNQESELLWHLRASKNVIITEEKTKKHKQSWENTLTNSGVQSLVVSDCCSDIQGSRFESGC